MNDRYVVPFIKTNYPILNYIDCSFKYELKIYKYQYSLMRSSALDYRYITIPDNIYEEIRQKITRKIENKLYGQK